VAERIVTLSEIKLNTLNAAVVGKVEAIATGAAEEG
jgi:hypothetical protein